MKYLHEHPEFKSLLLILEAEMGIQAGLIQLEAEIGGQFQRIFHTRTLAQIESEILRRSPQICFCIF